MTKIAFIYDDILSAVTVNSRLEVGETWLKMKKRMKCFYFLSSNVNAWTLYKVFLFFDDT